jgi:hypothetical protein
LTGLRGRRYIAESGDFLAGVIPAHFRFIHESRENSDSHLANAIWWTLFDGPMDPSWTDGIERSLSGGYLQLPHGELVHAPADNKFVFELEDLASASPSTVSRAGLVYMHASASDWSHLARSRIHSMDPRICNACVQLTENIFAKASVVLEGMIEMLAKPALDFVNTHVNEPIKMVSNTHRMRNMLGLFETLCERVLETLDQAAAVSDLHVGDAAGNANPHAHASGSVDRMQQGGSHDSASGGTGTVQGRNPSAAATEVSAKVICSWVNLVRWCV